jgi:hypothetical protein
MMYVAAAMVNAHIATHQSIEAIMAGHAMYVNSGFATTVNIHRITHVNNVILTNALDAKKPTHNVHALHVISSAAPAVFHTSLMDVRRVT